MDPREDHQEIGEIRRDSGGLALDNFTERQNRQQRAGKHQRRNISVTDKDRRAERQFEKRQNVRERHHHDRRQPSLGETVNDAGRRLRIGEHFTNAVRDKDDTQ